MNQEENTATGIHKMNTPPGTPSNASEPKRPLAIAPHHQIPLKPITMIDQPIDQLAVDLQALADRYGNSWDAELAEFAPRFDTRTGLATWYLGKLNEIEAKRALVKEQAAVMLKQLDSLEAYLVYRNGAEFKSCIDGMLQSQGGKKKSVDTLTGRAGYRRSSSKVTIIDTKVVLEWCKANCPQAIEPHIARTTPIKEHIENTGEEVPGVIYQTPQDVFYPSSNRPELEYSRVGISKGSAP